MALPIYRLRRLLAATAMVLTAAVIGMYIYARLRTRDVRQRVPNKLGIEIKQTANGFQFSKSDGKRTLFSVQASNVKELKLNGRAELHNVSIILYGRDSSRYDRIAGDDFAYDPKTGDVSAKGEVHIDLMANPAGASQPDQSAPTTIKDAIHLRTRDLVFNRESGNASTTERVEFSTPQASGWAVGAFYAGKSNVLTLGSQIHVEISGTNAAVIEAQHGAITSDPRQIVLDHPHLDRQGGMLEADRAILHLGPDDNVESVMANGNVVAFARYAPKRSQNQMAWEIRSHAEQAELLLTGDDNRLRTMTLTGNVHIEQSGPRPMQGEAGRVILNFAGDNQLQSARATDGARLEQEASGTSARGASPENYQVSAPTIDFIVVEGNRLERAETSGAAKITIASSQTPGFSTALRSGRDGRKTGGTQNTVVTAGKFVANFATADGKTYPTAIHGAPDARIVSFSAGDPERVSTSDAVDAVFLPQGGIESVTQTGNVFYTDNQPLEKRVQAWAANAHYAPADKILTLSGSPRLTSGSMTTTAETIRINRATGEAAAETDVKSTYSDLKEQPDGALLASASPIHATARSMVAQSNPGIAVYNGSARLWQDANAIEAPTIQFDRDRRFVTAQGSAEHPVQTTLVQANKESGETPAPTKKTRKGSALGKSSPITITARRLTYADSDRKIHYEGGVMAKGEDFTASSKTLDAYLRARGQSAGTQAFASAGQLDRMVAEGDVLVQEPSRRAEGEKLVYTAADDRFVLTGGPPSIFDAEQGKITGVSLTFFRRDDRVLVEGEASTPVVTRTRVAP
jgi:lipopolysaccharide export system protein LptA